MTQADLAQAGTDGQSRSARLDQVVSGLVASVPEVEAASVVSFDGLAMAACLPDGMDEDRVAAMSAALLSLGERAAEGLGRGELKQVWIEGESGTVFLVSADDEAVLVAVAAPRAKVGLLLFELRGAAAEVAAVLRAEDLEAPQPAAHAAPPVAEPAPAEPAPVEPAAVEPAAVGPVAGAVAPAQPVRPTWLDDTMAAPVPSWADTWAPSAGASVPAQAPPQA